MRFPALALAALIALSGLGGCAVFKPVPLEEVGFMDRVETIETDEVRVSFAVLTTEESRKAFGTNLGKHKIQPVWFRVENRLDHRFAFLPITVDPDYFSPREASSQAHFFMSPVANKQMDAYFSEHEMPLRVPPHETSEGFVFTNLHHGAKAVNIELIGSEYHALFDRVVIVPGLRADYLEVDWENLYPAHEEVVVDEAGLRSMLGRLPATTTDKDGTWAGDPLNLVIIGDKVGREMVARSWDLTEIMNSSSVWKTIGSSVFGFHYRYSPISPLYVYGRPQDIAFQKARSNVNERNHLRLWLTPITFEGKMVLVGQISRDIGVRIAFETFPPVTHLIDPDVDEARTYVTLDLAKGGRVEALGYINGVGAATPEKPRGNLTGDAYFTDGRRIVIILADERTPLTTIRDLDWD